MTNEDLLKLKKAPILEDGAEVEEKVTEVSLDEAEETPDFRDEDFS